MVELTDDQKEFLSMAEAFDRIKMRGNVKALFGGKKQAVENIKDLEDKDLVERVSYGIWELTDQGEKYSGSKCGCLECGRVFDDVEDARSTYSMWCDHNDLSYRLEKFTD